MNPVIWQGLELLDTEIERANKLNDDLNWSSGIDEIPEAKSARTSLRTAALLRSDVHTPI